jgi:hypothetical protein
MTIRRYDAQSAGGDVIEQAKAEIEDEDEDEDEHDYD